MGKIMGKSWEDIHVSNVWSHFIGKILGKMNEHDNEPLGLGLSSQTNPCAVTDLKGRNRFAFFAKIQWNIDKLPPQKKKTIKNKWTTWWLIPRIVFVG